MSKYRVLLTDFAWPDVEIERRLLAQADAELVVASAKDSDSLAELASQCDAIMTCWTPVGREVLDAATRCRVVARLGIGLDNIDVEHATRLGIPVTNVPDYCLVEVAEHTLALVLALARRIAFYHQEAKQGRYDLRAGLPIRRLAGQTLGIVGLGRIGRMVASKASALGLRVLGTSRTPNDELDDVTWCTLEELLAQSDFVSLHLPLSDDSHHLLSERQFAAMKSGASLINTARGGLVDHSALASALQSGHLAGAALDVHEPEPPPLNEAPWNLPQVIVTPHAAFISESSVSELRHRATQQVVAALAGQRPENVVNPQVLD